MKVIIVGKGSGWEDAPMEGETWGLNDLILRRSVRLSFEMHNLDEWYDKNHYNFKQEREEINKLGIPVVTQKKHKLFPTAIPFPIDEMPIKYFTNSIAYMIAYAIHKGATEIEMYGVPLIYVDEYTRQLPCVEYWIGYARGKGIKVTIHGSTNIFSPKPYTGLYGYDWDNIDGQKT